MFLAIGGLAFFVPFIILLFFDWDKQIAEEKSDIKDRIIYEEPQFEKFADNISACADTASYCTRYI